MTNKFKVGDKVELTIHEIYTNTKKGSKGVVTEIVELPCPYVVEFEGGRKVYLSEEALIKVEEKESPKVTALDLRAGCTVQFYGDEQLYCVYSLEGQYFFFKDELSFEATVIPLDDVIYMWDESDELEYISDKEPADARDLVEELAKSLAVLFGVIE